MRPFLLLLILGTAQFFLRPEPESESQASLAIRFPGVVHSVVLGGFRPMVVQYLWWDLEAADEEGRHADILRNLTLLQQVEPDNARATLYLAYFLAYTLKERESAQTGRLRRIEQAIDLLQQAETRLPREVSLPLLRGQLLANDQVWSEPRLYVGWTKRRGETPYAGAVAALRRAAELATGARHVHRLLADALRMRALELLLKSGDAPGAASLLAEAVGHLDQAGATDTTARRLAIAWSGVVLALRDRDPVRAAAALGPLAAAIREVDPPNQGGTGTEERLAGAILRWALDLGRSVAIDGPAVDALSLAVAIHNIQALLEARLEPIRTDPGADQAFRKELRALVKDVVRRAPHLQGRVPTELR
ncbi:MAG: hypothetical protein CMJ83_17985 [Planctomycetes bacterium]|nr:hypothetical protein [Planctomycetota bacterium]